MPAKELMEKLGDMGEYVKSAASVVEAPVERKIREVYPDPPPKPVAAPPPPQTAPPVRAMRSQRMLSQRMRDPFDPLYAVSKPPPRGPYMGAEPTGLKRKLLDRYIVPRSTSGRRPHGGCKYWASEVAEAESLTREWADALLEGMTEDEVLRWIGTLSAASSEQAAALFAAGIDPEDLEFDLRYDIGRQTMQTRLIVGNMTVQDVVAEVRRRRAG